jgi:hypothetical protein
MGNCSDGLGSRFFARAVRALATRGVPLDGDVMAFAGAIDRASVGLWLGFGRPSIRAFVASLIEAGTIGVEESFALAPESSF